MAWGENAAGPIAETFDGALGALGAPGAVVATACIDEAGTAIAVRPSETPADGRFEIGSVTKTMTATLLALLDADGTLRLDDERGRPAPGRRRSGLALAVLQPRLPPSRACSRAGQRAFLSGAGGEAAARTPGHDLLGR
jgi:CubicO group peptidase (beta-lactamase class C family)